MREPMSHEHGPELFAGTACFEMADLVQGTDTGCLPVPFTPSGTAVDAHSPAGGSPTSSTVAGRCEEHVFDVLDI